MKNLFLVFLCVLLIVSIFWATETEAMAGTAEIAFSAGIINPDDPWDPQIPIVGMRTDFRINGASRAVLFTDDSGVLYWDAPIVANAIYDVRIPIPEGLDFYGTSPEREVVQDGRYLTIPFPHGPGSTIRVMFVRGEAGQTDSPPSARPNHNIAIRIDGEYLTDLDVPATIVEGRTLIPVRAVTEALGAEVGWNAATRTVTITKDGTIITMIIDNRNATINGSATQLDVAPIIIDGRTMLPIRFIAETFGWGVDWDAANRNVVITTQ